MEGRDESREERCNEPDNMPRLTARSGGERELGKRQRKQKRRERSRPYGRNGRKERAEQYATSWTPQGRKAGERRKG